MFVFETCNVFQTQQVLHPWIKTYEDRHILHENRLEYGVKLTAVKLCANNSLRVLMTAVSC